jgi:hypothetical protein
MSGEISGALNYCFCFSEKGGTRHQSKVLLKCVFFYIKENSMKYKGQAPTGESSIMVKE